MLLQCLHDSNFLRLLLHIIDEGCRVLELHSSAPGVQNLEAITLNVLFFLKRVLQLQVTKINQSKALPRVISTFQL